LIIVDKFRIINIPVEKENLILYGFDGVFHNIHSIIIINILNRKKE